MNPVLLVAAPLLFAACALAGTVLLRTSTLDKEIAARIDAVALTGRPKLVLATPSITKKDRGARPGWRETMTSLFGFSLARTDQYTIPWIGVLIAALLIGRVAVLLASGVAGVWAWALMPIVTIMMSRAVFGSMISKRIDKLRSQFPDALGLIVRAVRVGIPVSEALRAVSRESPAPTAAEFDRLADQISIGASLEVALREMAERNSLPEYGFFAAALSLQASTGGGLGETLDLLADVTRKRVSMKARGHALSAEARTSSLILSGLPIAAGLALYAINPGYIGLLLWDETGRMILGCAVLSLSMGTFVMRMIIRMSLSA